MIRHALLALALAAPSLAAADPAITVSDAYARAASPVAKSGGVFMVIDNAGDSADRLLSARTDAAMMAELHGTTVTDGIARMAPLDGVTIPAGGSAALARGGDHVMLMGLTAPLADGDDITLTLTFEQSGDITVTVPVDNAR